MADFRSSVFKCLCKKIKVLSPRLGYFIMIDRSIREDTTVFFVQILLE